jgi:hypothetical protein
MFLLLKHLYLQKVRSFFWKKSIVASIFLSLFSLYFLSSFGFFGVIADKIIADIYPNNSVLEMFTRFVFSYYLVDFVVRFKFQTVSLLDLQHYLFLPFSKKKLFHFPLISSIFSFFNVLAFLFLLPFFFVHVIHNYTVLESIVWFCYIYGGILTVNFLSLGVKFIFTKKAFLAILLFMVVLVLLTLENRGIIAMSKGYFWLVKTAMKYPWMVVFPILLVIGSYRFTYLLLLKNRYDESLSSKKTTSSKIITFQFLEKYGNIGHLIMLELKFILRNKKTRTMLFSGVFFLFYGIMFYGNENFNIYSFKGIFVGLFMCSGFLMNIGQIALSGYSSHFDGLMTLALPIKTLFRVKYIIYALAMILSYILTLPYYFLDAKILLVNLALLVYGVGIFPYVFLYLANFKYQPFDISQNKKFDVQGFNFRNFIPLIPVMLIPYLLHGICYLLGNAAFVYYILAGLGILGIATNSYWIGVIERKFHEQKYKLAEGFRSRG